MSPFAKGASPPKRNAEAVQTALDAAAARIRELELEAELASHVRTNVLLVARAEKAEARVAELEGLVKDYELWCLEMGRAPIAREREAD